jgi:hypothetical protein
MRVIGLVILTVSLTQALLVADGKHEVGKARPLPNPFAGRRG